MPLSHTLLAVLTVAVWGCNFVVIRWGLDVFPPMLFGALRFALAALPLVFFYKLPRSHWRAVAVYGLLQFVIQFAGLFTAVALGMPPGLTSLVVQSQAVFTVILAALVLGERVNVMQSLGLLVAFTGIAYAAFNVTGELHVSAFAFGLAVLGALGWGAGNVQLRRMGTVLKLAPLPPLALMSWASLMAAPSLFALSVYFEGAAAIIAALRTASWGAWGAVLFQSYANTLLGYGIWAWLIGKHGVIKVAPYSLLVPLFGLTSTAWFLGETLQPWKWGVFALIVGGLAVNQWGALTTLKVKSSV
jgi:O-acetylserine/cysteine efflux transporter